MDDLYNKIVQNRNGFENLIGRLPGFRGYMEMSGRREADRIMRDHVAGLFQTQITRFESIERDIIRNIGIGLADKTRDIKSKMQNLQTRIKTDTPGYTGFFASNKIGPDELQKVYAFDEAMARYSDDIGTRLDELSAAVNANEGVDEALAALETTAIEAAQAYNLRDSVLNGLEE